MTIFGGDCRMRLHPREPRPYQRSRASRIRHARRGKAHQVRVAAKKDRRQSVDWLKALKAAAAARGAK